MAVKWPLEGKNYYFQAVGVSSGGFWGCWGATGMGRKRAGEHYECVEEGRR